MRSLLIGCGTNHQKQVQWGGRSEWSGELTTLDINPNCGADVLFDMAEVTNSANKNVCLTAVRLPFDDNTFDEMGCYNAMEHWGHQGDFRGWFGEMSEYHRILKPGGMFGILVPIGQDALADPGHTRFFQRNYFGFLNQSFYELNAVKSTCFTDYRWYWKLNFDVLYLEEVQGHHLAVILRKG